MLFMIIKTSILIKCVSPFFDYIYHIKAEGAILPPSYRYNSHQALQIFVKSNIFTELFCLCVWGAGLTGSYEPPDTGAEKRALVPAKAAF